MWSILLQKCPLNENIKMRQTHFLGDLEHKRAVARAVTDSFVHDNKLYSYHVSAKNGENVR